MSVPRSTIYLSESESESEESVKLTKRQLSWFRVISLYNHDKQQAMGKGMGRVKKSITEKPDVSSLLQLLHL